MSETCLDVKRLFAWMKRSWTFSGLNTSHGTASKTYVARRMSNLPRGSGLRCSKPNMPFFEPSFTTTPPPWRQSQLGKRWCSAAGSSSDDLQLTRLKATAHTIWKRDRSSFGLRTGLLSGPWNVLNMLLLRCRTRRSERTSSRCSHVFVKLLHQHALVKKGEPQQLPETHHQSQSRSRLFKRSRVSIPLTQNPQLLRRPSCRACSYRKWLSTFLPPFAKCQDSVSQDHLECARDIGTTSALWRGTATCLCKLLHTQQHQQFPTQCYNTQSWTDHTACHTDVVSPQTCAQISSGSKERISGQVCGTLAVWCWKTRRCKHDDQDHPTPRGG